MQNIQSLKKLLSGIVEVDQQITVTGICNDSRRIKPGDLYIASVGKTFDSRQFIPSAIEQGAAAIVYEHQDGYQLKLSTSFPAFPIAHLNRWQGIIASRFHQEPSRAMHCVGVTGTNGKTSCTQWIAQALLENHIACGVIGTLGSGFPPGLEPHTFTTPDPVLLQALLAKLYERGANAVALEVSSHALAQYRLNGVHFDVAVFTQLSRDHLDYHGDMENYAAAKRRLFEWDELRAAVINIDDPIGEQWAGYFSDRYPVITYSLSHCDALIHVSNIQTKSDGFLVSVRSPWGRGDFHLPFLGRFAIYNALAVLGVLVHFDLPFQCALASLSHLQAVPGRMEMLGGKEQPLVVVDYSHTPDALKNALSALREHCTGRLWCVFGCGGDRDRGKRAEMAQAAESYSDHIIVTNDNPRTESPECIVDDIITGFSKVKPIIEMNRASAIAYAIQKAAIDDVILIAGKGHENYQIVGTETLSFSDSEQVKQQLARRLENA